MAITVKAMANMARKNLTSNQVTIQPGAVATLFFSGSSLSGYSQIGWMLASDNDSSVYSDLIITGGMGRIIARNMGTSAFTGTIKIEAYYYPYNNLVYA